MPTISLLVDNTLIARVRTNGLDVLAVSVGGTKVDETFATIEMSGGKYLPDGQSTHLTWLSDHLLHPGQCVRVEISSQGDDSVVGKTLAELFPDSTIVGEGKDLGREDVIDSLRQRPRFREGYTLAVRASLGDSRIATVTKREHGFGASFLWNAVRPDRMSASLHTYSLDQLASQEDFTYHFRERLCPDAWAELTATE